jgi:TonB family protein
MEDRVGEVLARRAELDAGPALAIAVAVLAHAGLAAAAVWAAMHAPAVTSAPVLTIKFAGVERRASSPVMPMPQAKAPVPPPVQPRIEPPAPKVEDAKPSTAPPVPNAVPLSPFGKSTKKGAENPVVKPPVAAAPATDSGPVGIAGIEGGDFPYTIYIERMKTLIGQHWLRPQIGGAPNATVYFVVEHDGTVRDVRIETPSNVPAFDRAAQRAILESSPLPPLPFGYGGTYLGVHLKFQ